MFQLASSFLRCQCRRHRRSGEVFATCVYASYEDLPESMRPAFVEQIKQDFFSRKGMMYVKKEDLPKALQDVFPSTTYNVAKQEDDKRQ